MTGSEFIKAAEQIGQRDELIKAAAQIVKEALWGKVLASGLIAAPLLFSKYRGDVNAAEMRGYALAQQRLLPFITAMNAPQGTLNMPYMGAMAPPSAGGIA